MAAEPIFAACAPGLEQVLERELSALGLDARAVSGGVEASGPDAVAVACIGARSADAVSLRLYDGPARGVDAAVRDARRRLGAAAPAIRRDGDRGTVSIDAAGAPLYKRGWRARIGGAPLRESIAAGMLLFGGYDGGVPFLDPMCGSGTLAIEAAALAARRAPGLRRTFSFETWPWHEPARTERVRARFAALERAPPHAIHASDRNSGALRLAQKNAASAALAGFITFARQDAGLVLAPPGPGFVAANPPFGIRLPDARTSWSALARLLDRAPGCTCVVLAPDRGLERLLGRAPVGQVAIRNGGLACRVLVFQA